MNNYRNILLIEDDPAVAHSLIDGLKQANFEVTWKKTAVMALPMPRSVTLI